MQIRFRIFLWVAALFIAFLVAIIIVTNLETETHLAEARKELEKEIVSINQENREDLLTYLSLEMTGFQEKIATLFTTLEHLVDFQKLYLPTNANIETKTWGNVSTLLASYSWVDYVQLLIDGQESSFIVSEPPYVKDVLRIAVNPEFALFVTRGKQKEKFNIYAGVPYWNNEIIFRREAKDLKAELQLIPKSDDWLLFDLETLKTTEADKLKPKDLRMTVFPRTIPTAVHSIEDLKNLAQTTVDMIKLTQENLEKYPKIVRKVRSSKEVQSMINTHRNLNEKANQEISKFCRGNFCNVLAREIHQEYWNRLQYGSEQPEQIQLIWELATITGTGLWNFDPFSKAAPIGIARIPWQNVKEYLEGIPAKGSFVKTTDIFKRTPIPVERLCKLKKQESANISLCVNPDYSIVSNPELNGIFLTGTMFFEMLSPPQKKPHTSALTVGISLDDMLYKLAVVTPDSIMMVTNTGLVRFYGTNGEVKDLTHVFPKNISELIKEKSGKISDVNGTEYFFVHLTSMAGKNEAADGHVLVIERKEGEYQMMTRLRNYAYKLMYHISEDSVIVALIGLVIILLILNQVIKKITKPLYKLAGAARSIGAGHFSEVKISSKSKQRKDELGALFYAFDEMMQQIKKGEEVRSLLDKVVSKEVAEKILSEGVKLGGELRDVTIMFSDIRNFTQITEHMNPKDVLDMLNDCLTILSRVIDDSNGIIDKYEGDEIMALFGAPLDMENHALTAILCAIDMREVLRVWNNQREAMGKCKLEIGTGIHSGQGVAGNVGAENHLSYTVLGHMVNLAARICSHAEGMEILITEDVLNQPRVREAIQYEAIEPVQFKGISQPVQLYRVLSRK